MSWATETTRTMRYLRTPENAPVLPVFPLIKVRDVPPGSSLAFQGLPGNWATERVCVHKYGAPFHPHFHAALMRRDELFHNVGKFRTTELLSDEFRSERRIDVVIYKTMTDVDRVFIMQAAAKDLSKPKTGLDFTDYGVRSFLHQGLRFIKPGKEPMCSQNVVKLLLLRGIRSSYDEPVETVPFELVTFALARPDLCELRTVWVGDDFAMKAAGRPAWEGVQA